MIFTLKFLFASVAQEVWKIVSNSIWWARQGGAGRPGPPILDGPQRVHCQVLEAKPHAENIFLVT